MIGRCGLLSLAILTAGCGDRLADGSYLGEPLFSVQGRIEGDAGTSQIRRPYLGVLWMDMNSMSFRVVTTLAPIRNPRFPGEFSIDFFDTPPADVFFDSGAGPMALGFAIVLDDVNGDGAFAFDEMEGLLPPDLMFGAANEQYVAYLDSVGNQLCQEATFGVSGVKPGYHLISWESCFTMPLLPPGTPLRVGLFPPGQLPPYEGMDEEIQTDGEKEPPAEGEDPSCELTLDCFAEPDHPICQVQRLVDTCIEEECTPIHDALARCAEERCAGNWSDDCLYVACGAEVEASDHCVSQVCSMGAVCAAE